MPKEAFYFGFRFRWLVGFEKHLQNTGREGREAFGLAKHLTNPADRSGSGQESRQPSQRCEQSMNKYNETPSWLRPRDTRLGKVVIAKEKN